MGSSLGGKYLLNDYFSYPAKRPAGCWMLRWMKKSFG
jgi:hypothetical protein